MRESEAVSAQRRRLGAQLATFRHAAGLTQWQLAGLLHYERTSIAHVEAGRQPAPRPFWQHADQALHAGGVLVSAFDDLDSARQRRARQARQQRQAEHAAKAREWRATGSASDDVASITRDLSVPAATDVVVIRDMLGALTTSDRQFGGGHAREYAADYLWHVVLSRLRAHGNDHASSEVFAVSTEFALRVSSMHMDAGHFATSRKLLGTASSLAQETDDLTLGAWVLARHGEQEMHQKDINRALTCTSGAAAMARQAPPKTRAFILTKHALAVSLTGDRDETQRALGEVWGAYDRSGSVEEPEWMRLYGWGHLRHEEGRCYANLGMGQQAARAAEDSIQLRGRNRFARPRAFSLGVQAIGHAQAGEVDRSCAVGHELVTVAQRLASGRVRIRLTEVLRALHPYRNVAAVRDFHEAVRPVAEEASR